MKIKLAILVLFAGLTFISCKKEEKAPTNSNTNTGGGGGGGNSPTPSGATTFYGIFTTGNYATITSSVAPPFISSSARAYFSSQSTQYSNNSTAVTVNNVGLNGDTLNYNPSYKYYTTSSSINLSTETWSVNGANGIGTFSINISSSNPTVGSLSNLPDSISISSGFSVAINNVANAGKAYFIIIDGTNTANGSVTKILSTGNNNVNFSASDLSNLTPTSLGYLVVALTNGKAYWISGKDYQFNREAQFTKFIKIKP
jgi:hypothetical protein